MPDQEFNEDWVEIPDFELYAVSNTGKVFNVARSRVMQLSLNPQGAPRVALSMGGRTQTKSVKVLVAEGFVENPNGFDTPMLLDGDQENLLFTNITWRPRWFALQYARQWANDYAYYHANRIDDRTYGNEYDDIWHAAREHGLLLKDVLTSCHRDTPCWPGGFKFQFMDTE